MIVALILGVSLLLQLAAAIEALRLIRVTGRHRAWLLIAGALVIMTIRRMVLLGGLLSGSESADILLSELLGLLISACLLAGVASISPLLRAMQNLHEELERRVEARTAEVEQVHATMQTEVAGRVQRRTAELERTNLQLQQEIAERHRVEAELRENEQHTRALIAAIPDLLFKLDRSGTYRKVYAPSPELLAASREELLGRTMYEVLEGEAGEMVRIALEAAFSTGQTQIFEYDLQVPAGWRTFEARFSVSKPGEEMLAIVRDITERKQADIALKKQRAFLHTVIDANPNLIFVKDERGVFTLVNRTMATTYGTTVEALVGKTDADFNSNPDEVEGFVAADREVLARQSQLFIPEEVLTHALTGEKRWYQTIKMPIGSPGGEQQFVLGVATDITERKLAEQQALELALEKERSKILAHFIQDASHEFATPLSVINTSLYLLEQIAGSERQQHHIDLIFKQVEHIGKLVEGLLAMSRLNSGVEYLYHRLNLNHLIREVLHSHEAAAERKNLTIKCDLDGELPHVQADQNYLHQALAKLVENAIEYTPDSGAIMVRTGQDGDGHVMLAISDTGIGISPDDLPHIFDHFYRVDPARSRRGAGLGLSMSRKIIESHQGRIEVESALGEGSTFSVFLPIAAS
ncbi:MAG: PAS domain-containing protein [Chloroflexi bacterium]|nr:PAS domain-containing protein [Chloroflexota bacterium]